MGWRILLEGIVVDELQTFSERICFRDGYTANIKMWMKALVVHRLLEVFHRLWVYQNLMVRNHHNGVFSACQTDQIIDETARLCGPREDNLSEEDCWIWEISMGGGIIECGDCKVFWLLVIKVA